MIGETGPFLSNRIPEPDDIIQSQGAFVTPRSLYYAQLKDRLGANALQSVVLPNQKSGPIWTELASGRGMDCSEILQLHGPTKRLSRFKQRKVLVLVGWCET